MTEETLAQEAKRVEIEESPLATAIIAITQERVLWQGTSGTSLSSQHAGVAGSNDNGGIGVFGKGNPAGFFDGNVTITGHINNGGSDLTDQVVALQQQVALLQGAVAGLQH